MDLKKYSALAASIFLIKKESDAQIVYTDIPDVIIPYNSYIFLDLNNDGIHELKLEVEQSMSSNNTGNGWEIHHLNRYFNAMPIGNVSLLGTSVGGTVAALYQSDIVSGNGVWLDNNFELASWRHWNIEYAYGTEDLSGSTGNGNWLYKTGDNYMGLRFSLGTDTFYGWVRLSVNHYLMKVTIKDYAYQTNPGAAIYAGETLAVGTLEIPVSDLLVSCLPDKMVQIVIRTPQFIGANVRIINLMGEISEEVILDKPTKYISLQNLPSGLYALQLSKDGKQVAASIVLH